MNAEKQRIAIAGACGKDVSDLTCAIDPKCNCCVEALPDYLNSLDAIMPAIKGLKDDQRVNCVNHLCDIMPNVEEWITIEASASQWAEAFLRTLNLWEPAPHD